MNYTVNKMASIITRLTLARTLLCSVDCDIDILRTDVRKRSTKELLGQLDRLMKDLSNMDDLIGSICTELPEIFISLEHLNQPKTPPSDHSQLLSPENLAQLIQVIAKIGA